MTRRVKAIGAGLLMLLFVVGCGSSDAPSLAEAGGTIKYNGKPLAGANVVFTPDSGPVAVGTTDDQGRFVLSTHGQPGAAIGNHKVSITAYEASATKESDVEEAESGDRQVKSLIPEKYANYRTSGLTKTVSENAAENDFPIELRD